MLYSLLPVVNEPIDLDASCVAFDEEGNAVDVIFYNHLAVNVETDEFGNRIGKDDVDEPYMEHSGDNPTGEDVSMMLKEKLQEM